MEGVAWKEMDWAGGIEPPTSCLEGRRSILLSYAQCNLVGVGGIEPPAFCSQSRRAAGLRYTPSDWSQRMIQARAASLW